MTRKINSRGILWPLIFYYNIILLSNVTAGAICLLYKGKIETENSFVNEGASSYKGSLRTIFLLSIIWSSRTVVALVTIRLSWEMST